MSPSPAAARSSPPLSIGSAEEFQTLLANARPRMFLVALAIVSDKTEAEDVLQDATITGLSKFRSGEFTPGTNFDAWMGQITRYTALNARRARLSAPAPLGDASERLGASRVAEPRGGGAVRGSDFDADDVRALREALDTLPEAARLCLLLRIVGGFAYSTIAQIAQLPEGTAMSHVHRAQRALRITLTARAAGAHSHPRQGGGR